MDIDIAIYDRTVNGVALVASGGVTSAIDPAPWPVERSVGRTPADGKPERITNPRFRPA
jgi:hypothetical protein